MNQEFISALRDVCTEKDIDEEVVFEALESAMIAAYKKNFDSAQNVAVNIDKTFGEIKVFAQKEVVDFVADNEKQIKISLLDAKEINPDASIGDMVNIEVTPKNFGRIAAMNAKQVITQKIREAEHKHLYNDYTQKSNDIVTVRIQHIEDNGNVIVDIGDEGRIRGILTLKEQPKNEQGTYTLNQSIKCYINEVREGSRGPQIILSRTNPNFVRKLFEREVPEIEEGIVEIKNIAREAGSRTKIAVYSNEKGIDPQGACIGPRGQRVQAITNELKKEKIDIVKWSENPIEFITASISPAKVLSVTINEEEKSAVVIVPEHQLSLAIGKAGQNARLAVKLTGWRIDIQKEETEDNDEEFGSISEEEIGL